MLVKFSVTNFKCFKEKTTFDLSKVGDYNFNGDLIKNGVINHAILVGENDSGKTLLGEALFAGISSEFIVNNSAINWEKDITTIFEYTFKIDNDFVDLIYHIKEGICIYKEVRVNDKLAINNKTDVYRYYQKNIKEKLFNFLDNMFYFPYHHNTSEEVESKFIDEVIDYFNEHSAESFKDFIPEELLNLQITILREKRLWISESVYEMLKVYFFIINNKDKQTFLFVDSIDKLSSNNLEKIMELISKASNIQCVVTTHNTFILKNRYTRPDCCFIIKDNFKINSMRDLTDKEIREAHNLEKMYLNGAF